MSKRDPLRQLIRKFPPPDELSGIIEGLSKESDRSAAIVAAAILEGMLEKIIVHRLKDKNPSLVTQLFNNRGPLSDFHSKILIASAFGIIGPNARDDMNRIKIIRNVFAHAAKPVTFETPEINREIKDFVLIRVMNEEAAKRGSPQLEMPNKNKYLLEAHILCIAHDGAHQQLGGDPILYVYSDIPRKEPG